MGCMHAYMPRGMPYALRDCLAVLRTKTPAAHADGAVPVHTSRRVCALRRCGGAGNGNMGTIQL